MIVYKTWHSLEGQKKVQTFFFTGGAPPPQTPPISRPGGLRVWSLGALDSQKKFELFFCTKWKSSWKCWIWCRGAGGCMGAKIPRKFWNGCSPKAVFRGSHSEIRLEMGFPLHLSQNSQESLAQGRGSDMVYGCKMYRF